MQARCLGSMLREIDMATKRQVENDLFAVDLYGYTQQRFF
jgi:hypothetical protein